MESMTDIRKRLALEDDGFRRLEGKHKAYEDKLAQLRDRRFLNDDERLDEVRLKKLKLAIKEQMEALVREAEAR